MNASLKNSLRSRSSEIENSKLSSIVRKSTCKNRSYFTRFDTESPKEISPQERSWLKEALSSPKYEKFHQLSNAIVILKSRLQENKNKSPSRITSFHRFSHNSPKSEKIGPGYYERLNQSFVPTHEFSSVARDDRKVEHKILSFRFLKRSMSPDSLEMITKKNSHFIQSYDNYRENLQEKTKAHNEKVSIVKRTKFESNRNQLEERRQDLRIKYDRKLLKLRKFEAMEVQRNWFSFFMFFSSILAVKYSINNYGIRKINSRKWFRLIWYASRFLGRLCIIIKRVRRRNKYKSIFCLQKGTVTWVYKKRQEFVRSVLFHAEKCKKTNTLYLTMHVWLAKVSQIQRFMRKYKPVYDARKRAVKLMWDKVLNPHDFYEIVMPAKRYSLNKNQTAINNGRDFISEGTKEKYCREFLRDRLLVQARMMGNFKEMSQDLSKKFKRHLVYRSAEASIQGSGRNLVISLPPAPRLKLYTANEYLKSYIKRANLEYLQTKEVANNRRNARLLTHVK